MCHPERQQDLSHSFLQIISEILTNLTPGVPRGTNSQDGLQCPDEETGAEEATVVSGSSYIPNPTSASGNHHTILLTVN